MKYSILLICVLLQVITVHAQPATLFGTVLSHRTQMALLGSHVWVAGQADTVITASDGAYAFLLPDGVFLVHFHCIGFCDSVATVQISGMPVELNMELRDPMFTCSVTYLVASTWPGHDVTTEFLIANPGGLCQLTFSISDTSAWLSAIPESGSIAPDSEQTITVFMDEDFMNPPEVTELLSVLRIEHNAAGSPYVIPVAFYEQTDPPGEADEPSGNLPSDFGYSAYPNPFNATTTITFDLPKAGHIRLAVYDLTGRLASSLASERFPAGEHSLAFDGAGLPSGIYFARLTAGTRELTQKLVLLK